MNNKINLDTLYWVRGLTFFHSDGEIVELNKGSKDDVLLYQYIIFNITLYNKDKYRFFKDDSLTSNIVKKENVKKFGRELVALDNGVTIARRFK